MEATKEQELIAAEILRSAKMPLSVHERNKNECDMYCVDWLAYRSLVQSVLRLENRRKSLEKEIRTLEEAHKILARGEK